MPQQSNYMHSASFCKSRVARANLLAAPVFLIAALVRVLHPSIENSVFWALLDAPGVLLAGFAFLAGFTAIYQLHWMLFLVPGYICFLALLLAIDPFAGIRRISSLSYSSIVALGLLLSLFYLVVADVGSVLVYLVTGVSQFVDSQYDGARLQKVGSIIVGFVVLRFVVAIAVGQLVTMTIASGRAPRNVLFVGVFLPLTVELALYRMLIPDWFSMELEGIRIAVSYFVPPLLGGVAAGALGVWLGGAKRGMLRGS
jgi:hypothetical protein